MNDNRNDKSKTEKQNGPHIAGPVCSIALPFIY